MGSSVKSYTAGSEGQRLFWPLVISLAGHVLLFSSVLFSPSFDNDEFYMPGVIDVQIVNVPEPQATGPNKIQAVQAKAAAEDKIEPKEMEPATPVSKPTPEVEPEVSIAPRKPKTKTALKYKTIKSKEVLQTALKRLEKEVAEEPDRQLQDTIKRLKEQVAKDARPAAQSTQEPVEGTGKKPGFFGQGSEQEADVIDLYRLEVAYAINKNWAFSEQLAGGGTDLVAQLVFKVMPDGEIRDIFFTDRSGNAVLDDSAYRAIVKSSPVKPHPPELDRPYLEIGLRFSPEGIF